MKPHNEDDVSLDQLCWMAREGQLLGPAPAPIADPLLSSNLYGPTMRSVQMERVEVVERDAEGNVLWKSC